MDALISVIVPVYNVEAYLSRCLDSIVSQTYRNLEIILVDDDSPDNCGSICDEYAKRDDRIRVIHKENGGSSSARNAGLDVAHGEYIGFVDSDDMIHPEMYVLLMNALRGSEKKIACCQSGWRPAETVEMLQIDSREVGIEDTLNGIFTGKVGTAVWCRLYHRVVWEELRFPVGETNEDYPLLVPTTVAAGGMVYVPAKLYFYRATPNSITATYWKKNAAILHKNMERIRKQVVEACPSCMPAFRVFLVHGAYLQGLVLEKYFAELNEESRSVYGHCIQIMRSNWLFAMREKNMRLKHKVLYTMVVTHTLRPIYKMLGRL